MTVLPSTLTRIWSSRSSRGKRNRAARRYQLAVERLEDRSLLAGIAGQVYEDLNADGRRDAVDRGLERWTIDLDARADGTIDATTLTDPDGRYAFQNLAPGTYEVISQAPTAPGAEWQYVSVSRHLVNVQASLLDGLDFPVFDPGAVGGSLPAPPFMLMVIGGSGCGTPCSSVSRRGLDSSA